MVEVRDDKAGQWDRTVFIDGNQLHLQCPENPIIQGDIVIVRCVTDRALSHPFNYNWVPKAYQVKPPTKAIETSGVNKGREITTFYLKLG